MSVSQTAVGTHVYDVMVVGLGAHGSATLYQLAKAGLNVLGIDRFELAHTQGSSHGDTRVTRKLAFEHPIYVDLVTQSYECFDELQRISSRPIFHKTGGIYMGKLDSELVQQCLHVAKAKNLNVKMLDAQGIKKLNPEFDLQGKSDIVGVYDPDSGVLFPENCILSFAEQAQKRYGAHVRTGTKYISHKKIILQSTNGERGSESTSSYFEVTTDVGRFNAKKLVFACGMWNKYLIEAPIEIRKIQVYWFRVPSNVNIGLKECPIFMYEVDRNPLYYVYGFPNYQGQGIKVGFSPNQHNRVSSNPDQVVRAIDSSEMDRIQHIVKEFLPNIGAQPIIDSKECFVTMTPDEHFIVDFDRNDNDILVLSPCSAHGFKYSAGIGKLAAEMVLRGERNPHYSMFRIDRFDGKEKQVKYWSDNFIKNQNNSVNPFDKYYLKPKL